MCIIYKMNKTLNDISDKKNKPVDQLTVRGINVAVWEHSRDDNTTYRQVTIKKIYKDQEGEIKDASSLNIHDIPTLIAELQEIYSKEIRKEYGKDKEF